MRKKITTTTAANPLGLSQGKKLFMIKSGRYSGRLIMLMQTSATEIKYSYADRPYTTWSTPAAIAADVADLSWNACMDAAGNVYVAYPDQTNQYMTFRKLSYADGVWSVGSAVVVYNSYTTSNPALAVEPGGKLWIGFGRLITSTHTLCIKSSTDSGATWGTGPTDAGDVITPGSSGVYPRLIVGANDLIAIYADGTNELATRSLPLSGSTWSGEFSIAIDTVIDKEFDAALSPDGMLGVVYYQQAMKYREYDGANWGPVTTLDSSSSGRPQLLFINTVPYVIYLYDETSDQTLVKYTHRKSGSWSAPAALDGRSTYLDSLLLYSTGASTYSDLTAESSDAVTADVYHPTTNAILKESGDIAFVGMNQKLRMLYLILSTAGVGGAVDYSYWDGTNWQSFTPVGGNYNLDSTEKKLVLWDDYGSMPQDWQRTLVNGVDRFWVRLEAGSSFSTLPVGSQMTAISDLHAFIIRR